VASDRLGLMMEMEADRMRDLRFADEEVVTERSVILEERAERVDSSAGGLFNEQMRATLFNNHPTASRSSAGATRWSSSTARH
jgi:zinc protease